MHQAVLMNADIDKSPESGDIGDNSREFHTAFQVGYFLNIAGEGKIFEFLTGITAGLGQFLEDIL